MKTFSPPPLFFGCPTCPRCHTQMVLTRIFPDRLGYDTRIYECPQCDDEFTENPEYKKVG